MEPEELVDPLTELRAAFEAVLDPDEEITDALGELERLASFARELLPLLGMELRARGDEVFTVPGAGAPYSRKLWVLADALDPDGADRCG